MPAADSIQGGIVRATARWDAFWFAPMSSRNLVAARVVLASVALWIVASRDLPAARTLPDLMWSFVGSGARIRFALGLPLLAERGLYLLLYAALLLTLAGIAPRISALMSGLLLYHFAPFESLIWTPNPYLRGLTFPTLGLLILTFSPELTTARWRIETSVVRWPVALMQLMVCEMYTFAALAKLRTSGTAWAGASNIRRWILLLNQNYGVTGTPPGYHLAAAPWACALIGWAGLAFESVFPLVLFSSRARRVLVPLALVFHVANIIVFHIVFQDLPVLLLFVDWCRRGEEPEAAL